MYLQIELSQNYEITLFFMVLKSYILIKKAYPFARIGNRLKSAFKICSVFGKAIKKIIALVTATFVFGMVAVA